jgi:hypothetical protein
MFIFSSYLAREIHKFSLRKEGGERNVTEFKEGNKKE